MLFKYSLNHMHFTKFTTLCFLGVFWSRWSICLYCNMWWPLPWAQHCDPGNCLWPSWRVRCQQNPWNRCKWPYNHVLNVIELMDHGIKKQCVYMLYVYLYIPGRAPHMRFALVSHVFNIFVIWSSKYCCTWKEAVGYTVGGKIISSY